jgi:hypothetical protein
MNEVFYVRFSFASKRVLSSFYLYTYVVPWLFFNDGTALSM